MQILIQALIGSSSEYPGAPGSGSQAFDVRSKMSRKRILIRFTLGAVTLYVVPYVVMSSGGYYEPAAYGGTLDSDGEAIIIPKGAFGYRWNPFGWTFERSVFEPVSEHSWLHVIGPIYTPLIFVDHKIWHTKKEMGQLESEEYRVKNFYDKEGFRNIEP